VTNVRPDVPTLPRMIAMSPAASALPGIFAVMTSDDGTRYTPLRLSLSLTMKLTRTRVLLMLPSIHAASDESVLPFY